VVGSWLLLEFEQPAASPRDTSKVTIRLIRSSCVRAFTMASPFELIHYVRIEHFELRDYISNQKNYGYFAPIRKGF